MAAKRGRFEEIYRQKTQAGESTFSAFKSTAAERRKELTDLRRMFPSSGVLGAMLESAFGKAYKYKGKGSAGVADKDTSTIDNKTLNVIRVNTAVTAKNSMVLPGMARDMNVMRQNIVKIAKHATGSAATRADAFFLKAKERENAYETQIAGKSPSRADGKQLGKDKEKDGFFSGLLSSIFGDGLKGLLKGGLIAGILVGIGKYFTDPEFRKSVNDMLNNLGTAIFGAEYWENLKTTIKDNLVEGALIVGGSYLAFKGAVALFTSALTGAAGTLTTAMGSMMRNPYVLAAIGLGAGAYAYNQYSKKKKIGEAIDAGQLKGVRDRIWMEGNYDHESGFEDPDETNKLNIELMETLRKASKDESNTAYRRGVAKTLLLELEKGQTKLPSKEDIISQNAKLGQTYDSGEVMPTRGLSQEQLDIDKKIKELKAEKNPAKNASEISKLQKQKRLLKGTGPTRASDVKTSPTASMDDSDFDYNRYQELVGFKESGGKYATDIGIGYIGKYGMGTSALEDLGLLKPGTHKKYGDRGTSAGIYQSDAWVEGMSLQKFLNSPEIQDDAMKRLTQKIRAYEEKEGIIKPGMSGTDIAERLYAQMHGSAKSLYLEGKETQDFFFKDASNKKSAEWMKTMYAKGDATLNNQTNAIADNTVAVNNLSNQMKEEKSATMTEMLAALIQSMGNSGTTVNNVNNTSVASAGSVASPYNEDMLDLFKRRASVGL